jgi:quercetin dioxygenase-like cupin family protein
LWNQTLGSGLWKGRYKKGVSEIMENAVSTMAPKADLPSDDLARDLLVVDPDSDQLKHVSIVGDNYTIMVSGTQTAGKYCLIDMFVSPGGGPGPHRHDFEEMFHVLEGEIEVTFRGEKRVLTTGMTVNIPANAPHSFKNTTSLTAHMLCMCTPAGQDEFFLAVGSMVPNRTSVAPPMDDAQRQAFISKANALAPRYQTELLKP